jgi:sn-glycerol 3-phosphate transport system permease protein
LRPPALAGGRTPRGIADADQEDDLSQPLAALCAARAADRHHPDLLHLAGAYQALVQSVQRQDAFGFRTTFVGLDNFRRLLADPLYLNSLRVTLVFSSRSRAVDGARAAAGGDGQPDDPVALALYHADGLALCGGPGDRRHPVVVHLQPEHRHPALPAATMGYDWNHRTSATDAMILVVIAAAWKQISYNFLFFLAGLQSIPHSLIEAAAIDGASPAKRFWTIVFPLLSPTTFFLMVVNITYAMFDTFGVIHATTQGGPAQATNILVYKVYIDGFVGLNLGASAAQSVILMGIVIALTVVQFRFIERRVNY